MILPHTASLRSSDLWRRCRAFAASVLLVGMVAAGSIAQTGTSAAVPDAQAIVFSDGMHADTVGITYNSKVPNSAVRNDVINLSRTAGWQVSQVAADTESATPGGKEMTSADFQVTNGAVGWATGVLLVEPYAVTFKRFNLITVHYVLGGPLAFKALRDYSDKYVDIKLDTANGSYTYTIKIKDHTFEKLDLPLMSSPPDTRKLSQTTDNPRGGSGKIIWAALVIAIAAGGIAYALSSRASRKPKGADEPKDGTKGTL